MFVRLVKKPNDRVSVRVVESLRIDGKLRQKIVCGIGTAHQDDTKRIEKLKSVGENVIISMKNESRPCLPGFENEVHAPRKAKAPSEKSSAQASISHLEEQHRIHKGIEDIFGKAFAQLDLFDCINSGYKKESSNEIFRQIVLQRIAAPASKRKSVKDLDFDKGISFDLDQVYRTMDKAYENREHIKGKIAHATKDLLSGAVDVAFFDVTTLYFESFQPDELRVSGYSKDAKFKETQVMLALITTTEGLPLGYELFPGNSYEGATLFTTLETIEAQYNLSSISVVADRAMFTKNNLKKLDEKGVSFIVAAKLKTMKKTLKQQVLHDFETIKLTNPELTEWTQEYELDGRRLIVNFSSTRAAKDSSDRQRLVERLEKKMKDGKVRLADLIVNSGTKKYLSIEKKGAKEATLNIEKIDQDSRWDGLHAVITNHCLEQAAAQHVLERYRGLWQIEEAFRVNKHDLKMRPIYHWTPKRIKAHILICFVAFALVAFVRKKLKQKNLPISFAEAREQLSRVQASIIKDTSSGQRFILPSKVNETQKAIYSAFGIKLTQRPTLL
jgi:transposase